MKTTILSSLALALATMPLTLGAAQTPATSKPGATGAAKTAKAHHKKSMVKKSHNKAVKTTAAPTK